MSFAVLPLLFAAETAAKSSDFSIERLLIILGVFVAPIVAGYLFANALRLPEYGWKLAVIFFAIVASTAQIVGRWPPALGVDLKGGAILVYEVDEEATLAQSAKPDAGQPGGQQKSNVDLGELATQIKRRLNPAGLKEIVVRPYGLKQIEIVIPEIDEKEIARVEYMMTNPGFLEFMIVADNASRDGDIIQAARDLAANPLTARQKNIYAGQKRIGFWAVLDREERTDGRTAPFRVEPGRGSLLRNGDTGEIIEWSSVGQAGLEAWVAANQVAKVEILMRVDEEYAVRGADLLYANPGHDQNLSPCIEFGMRGEGVGRMSELTGNNLPEQGVLRRLGIVFDGALKSAPTIQGHISDRGQITGRFSEKEVKDYTSLLKEGTLSAILKKQPISKNVIGSLLGKDTIERGTYALIASVAVVLGFILLYYQFAGFVACVALVLNVALTVAIMMLFKAPFTMPGLAGLVLTVGMSVDSNVLIYERMREEFAKGSGFRLALRNGFDRAMLTIIDSNLTTLLTGVVLYLIGTDQIKGFAITLVLGILTSMFTAIFFARVVFEIAERTGMIRSLSFFEFFHKPNFDFIALFKPAVVASVLFIGLGMAATVGRGRSLFDIDLVGGTEVTFLLTKPIDDVEMRKLVEEAFANEKEGNSKIDYSLHGVAVSGEAPDTVYRLDSSLQDVDRLKTLLAEHLGDKGKGILKHYKLSVEDFTSKVIGAAPTDEPAEPQVKPEVKAPETKEPPEKSETKPEDKSEEEPKKTDAPESKDKDKDAKDEKKSSQFGPARGEIQLVAFQADTPAQDAPEARADTQSETKAEEKPSAEEKPEPKPEATPEEKPATAPEKVKSTNPAPAANVVTTVGLRFPGGKIGKDALETRFQVAAKDLLDATPQVVASHAGGDGASEEWTLSVTLDEPQTRAVVAAMKETLEASPIWQSSSKIGGQVATDMQLKAVFAVVLSLVGIAIYVWFRFHKLSWGIAAVTSLLHDTLVMLGCIAMSYWVADLLRPLMVEEFKISLTVIAAFLTLIGYSINDTIVIFDRIREVRGKDPMLTAAMINDSLNQTLSRTILTSGTVFCTVVILYIWGGPGIHTFAFAMVVGVISGTYSTVFIAAPMLLWLLGSKNDKDGMMSV